MSAKRRFDRRSFLRGAGATAVLGAVGAKGAAADVLSLDLGQEQQSFDFDEPFERRGTDCSKWDGAASSLGVDLEVGMGVADQDFRAAPCITRALAERCRHENWGYLSRPPEYIDAIVDWNWRRYGLVIDPESITMNTGVHAGLISALQTFSPPGTRVLMLTPIYSGFYTDIRFTRTVAEDSPMQVVDGRYEIDFDDFERRARRSNVCIFCNPQNPTGNLWSPEDMTRIGEICLRHRVPVLSDEIHCDFVTSGNRYTPWASLDPEIVDNSMTFKAASKTFSLAAMKVGWFFSTNEDYLARVRSNSRADLATLSLVANHAAITEGDDWLDRLVPYLDANHDFAERYIRDNIPLLGYEKAQGTYLAWLDAADAIEAIGGEEIAAEAWRSEGRSITPERAFQEWLGEHAKVNVNAGSSYGTGGAGRMRMNLATQRAMLERGLDNIAEALARV